jgi:hypothetical protein
MSSLKSRNLRDAPRSLITSADELPDFDGMTADEEATFWETHDFAEGVLEEGPEVDAEVYAALGIPNPKRDS